jgi:hypothetical protein
MPAVWHGALTEPASAGTHVICESRPGVVPASHGSGRLLLRLGCVPGVRAWRLAQPLRVGPGVIQAEPGPGWQRLGEDEIGGVLQRVAQQAGGAGRLESH